MRHFAAPLALAAASVLPSLAAAQLSSEPSTRPVRFGIAGGVAVPVGDFKDRYQSGALRRELQQGVAGQAFVEARAPGTPLGFRASVSYNRFGFGKVQTASTGATVSSSEGTSQVLGGLANVTLQLPTGPIRPYVLAGLGAFNVKNSFSGVSAGTATPDGAVSVTNFGINGGAGVLLRLGGIEAFVEGRLTNVYTKQEKFGNLKSVQYVPVTFGLMF